MANKLYAEMVSRIGLTQRAVSDPSSPRKTIVREAPPGQSFTLANINNNLVTCVPVDIALVKAMTWHFFAATERATPLSALNQRFLVKEGTEWYWRGAYGAIAMPQVAACIELLQHYPDSRRAIITMGDVFTQDINRPACWSFLQFLMYEEKLHLLVTQRSLNISVMPCDLVILTELLAYVCRQLDVQPGPLHWYIGNLHASGRLEYTPGPEASLHVSTDTPWEDLCALFN